MAPPETSFAHPVAIPLPVPVPAPARPRADLSATIDDLHARHGEELLRFCRWMLKDPEDAADALQDTWIRAMSALGESRLRVTALRPWLYAIARNVCLDRLRDRKRASLHELDEQSGGETPGADEVVALRQEAGAALALVGALSERQRSALLMRELAGMSIPDIADALGLTADRAAWTISDARRALEESRAGVTLACEDARSRLASGHRGRTLRAHLGQCTACCAHDRRLRARRVLAPALVPFLWLRQLGLPLFGNPATAATVAIAFAVSATPQQDAPRPAERPVVASAGARPHPAAPAVARVPTPRPQQAPAPVRPARSAPRIRRRAVGSPALPPAQRPATAASPAPPAVAVAEPAAVALPTVVAPVQRVVTTVAEATQVIPAAGPLVEDAAATAGAVLDGLG